MIRRYLLNTNEITTARILLKILELSKAVAAMRCATSLFAGHVWVVWSVVPCPVGISLQAARSAGRGRGSVACGPFLLSLLPLPPSPGRVGWCRPVSTFFLCSIFATRTPFASENELKFTQKSIFLKISRHIKSYGTGIKH